MQARRTISTTFILGVATTLLAGGLAQANGDTEFTVVERAATDAVIDVGETGDSIGDILAFGNDLYDADNATVVGRDQGQCSRSNPASSWECAWTNVFDEGSITVAGPFYDDLRDVDLAITGGTGAYSGAGGVMTLHARDTAGSELEFTFHVQLDDDLSGEAEMDNDSDAAASPGSDDSDG